MTIQAFPGGGGAWFPPPMPHVAGNTPALTFIATMSASGHRVAIICQAPRAGNINTIVWGTRTVTTGATVSVDLQTVDLATGFPSGSLWAANTNASVVVGNADDNVLFASSLTAAATVAKGDLLAIVINNAGSGNMNVFTALAQSGMQSHLPFGASYNGSAWTANISGYLPMITLGYDDGTFDVVGGVYPTASALTATSLSTATTPDVVGVRFSLPFPARVRGCWMILDADGDYTVKLTTTAYNQSTGTSVGSGGVLAMFTGDKEVRRSTAPGLHYIEFTGTADLSANTEYFLLFEPSSTTAAIAYDCTTGAAAQVRAFSGLTTFYAISAKDPTQNSDWTNSTTRYPLMGLDVSGFDDGASSGSSMGWAPLSIVAAAAGLARSVASGAGIGQS